MFYFLLILNVHLVRKTNAILKDVVWEILAKITSVRNLFDDLYEHFNCFLHSYDVKLHENIRPCRRSWVQAGNEPARS